MKPVVTYEVYSKLSEKCKDCDRDANIKHIYPDGTAEFQCMSGWLAYLNEAALKAWTIVESLQNELQTSKTN